MNYSKFRITLDIHKHQSQVSIPVMYGDTAVQLYVTLSDGGMPYTIGKSCWAQFIANKPSADEPLARACIIEDGTTIRLDFDADIANVAGVYNCEVRLYGAEGILTSPCFTMVVDPRVTNSIGMDSGEATDLLDQIGLAMSQYKTAEEGRENAEAERVSAEEERVAKFGELQLNFEAYGDEIAATRAMAYASIQGITLDDDGVLQILRQDGYWYPVKEDTYLMTDIDLQEERYARVDGDARVERTLQEEIDKQARRISNLEEHISDDYFVTDDSVAYSKTVPARACSSAKLLSLGGMTYRDEETNTLRDSKVTEIKSHGANILPYPYTDTTKTQAGITYTDNGDGTITVNGTTTEITTFRFSLSMPLENGQTYSLKDMGAGLPLVLAYKDETGATKYVSSSVVWSSSYTFVQLYLQVRNTTVNNAIVKPMFNVGSVVAEYKPYRAEPIAVYPIPAEIQVRNGVNGYADTIDFESGKRIEKTYTVIFDGVTNGKKIGYVGIYSSLYYASLTVPFKCIKNDILICSHFKAVATVAQGNCYIAGANGTSLIFVPNDQSLDTIDKVNAWLKEEYDRGNPVTFTYALEEPIITDISAYLEDFDTIIEVEGGGSLEFVNEYKNAVPSAVKYLLKEESAV